VRFGVVTFPGSNCDRDCVHVLSRVLRQSVRPIWHGEDTLRDVDVVVLPGGFSYGDYLRTGAVARFSPVMRAVAEFAQKGGRVLGICNGFQVLLEAGLLEGAMLHNKTMRFICRDVFVRCETDRTPFTRHLVKGQVIRLPIAHAEGNYYASPEVLARLEGEGRVVFRYVGEDGHVSDAANPNGSVNHIAGICNAERNIVGLMPHPERASEAILGNQDGRVLFTSVMEELA
jgi:phosphoribosylformylglycinamidine synthase subunit PurQ / glutaminase